MSAPLTYVLIHGGSVSRRYWDRLLPVLARPAIAVDLPGRGDHPADLMTCTVDGGAASVVADVEAAGLDEVVLVAHSAGGLVVPGVAAALAGRVRRIVLNAASVPPEGGCGLDCMKPHHRAATAGAVAASRRDGTRIATPGPPDDPEPLRTAYGGRPLTDDELAFVVDPVRFVPDSLLTYTHPVSWRQVDPDVPVVYLRNLHDGPVPPALQDEMIGRLDRCTVVDLDTGHIPAITDPDVLAAALEALDPLVDG